MTSNTTRPFRAIIIGGSVAGLTASHIFEAAGIDHVVCERGSEIGPPWGASIAIYPSGARLLKQLGILKVVEDASGVLNGNLTLRWPDGSMQHQSPLFANVDKDFGHDFMILERRAFLKALYNTLPRKDRILTGKQLKTIKESPDQIEVFFEDGTSEIGDIVVGCDGVHSTTRDIMWTNANRDHPGMISTEEKKGMNSVSVKGLRLTISAIHTEYTCLLGMGPPVPHLPHELSCTYDKDVSFLLGSVKDHSFFFAFEKIPRHSLFNAPRYTEADAEAAAARVAEHPVAETMVFKEFWKNRTRGCLVDVEQGVLDHWYYSRIVLVGDAVAKVTPNQALGGNSGMESAAVLVNQLQPLLKAGVRPSRAQIVAALQKYQDLRLPRMQQIMSYSRFHTRTQAWRYWPFKMFALYVVPLLGDRFLADDVGAILRGAPRIDFLPCTWPKSNRGFDDEKTALQVTKAGKAPALSILVAFSSLLWYFGYLGWNSSIMVEAFKSQSGIEG